jgi:SOS-response transcriptional repressor LexA
VGRIVLVQFNSMGDPENGGRFTVKKFHSTKTVSEDRWRHESIELLPLNQEFEAISVAPHEGSEMMVVGEWVAAIV